jgi:hypothetical protein
MIRPLPAPRFSAEARSLLAVRARAFGEGTPVLVVEVEGPEDGHPRPCFRLVPSSEPVQPGFVERDDVPIPIRFSTECGLRLAHHVIDVGPFEVGSDPTGAFPFLLRRVGVPCDLPTPARPPLDRESLTVGLEILSREMTRRIEPLVERCGGAIRLLRLRSDAVAEVVLHPSPAPNCPDESDLLRVVQRIFRRAFPPLDRVVAVAPPSSPFQGLDSGPVPQGAE